MGVRWDDVVDRDRFGLHAARRVDEAPASATPAGAAVEVLLFGGLADSAIQRQLTLQLASPFSIGEVLGELGRRLGSEFLSRVTEPGGGKLRCCRVFVNGELVDDIGTRLRCAPGRTKIEMILLTAAEGG